MEVHKQRCDSRNEDYKEYCSKENNVTNIVIATGVETIYLQTEWCETRSEFLISYLYYNTMVICQISQELEWAIEETIERAAERTLVLEYALVVVWLKSVN